MSMVPSVEALSTTMTSLNGYLWESTDSRQRLMKRPLSYVTIVTETKSFCAMNQDQRGRSSFSPLYTLDFKARRNHFAFPAEQKASAGDLYDFPINCRGLQASIKDRLRNASQQRARYNRQANHPNGPCTE